MENIEKTIDLMHNDTFETQKQLNLLEKDLICLSSLLQGINNDIESLKIEVLERIERLKEKK